MDRQSVLAWIPCFGCLSTLNSSANIYVAIICVASMVGLFAMSFGLSFYMPCHLASVFKRVLLKFTVSGNIGTFDWFTFILALVSLSAVWNWSKAVVDEIAERFLPGFHDIR